MTIQAIETRYAGCRFRSRLEARWAVFFDRLGVAWEYEPQGYMVGWSERPRPYLPDFWLPAERVWVEVKGSDDQMDKSLICDAAIPHGGLPDAPNEHRMLILGPLPRPRGRVAHSLLTFHKGDIFRVWAEFGVVGIATHEPWSLQCGGSDWVGSDSGDIGRPSPGLVECAHLPGSQGKFEATAYAAARSARFEHGESGA